MNISSEKLLAEAQATGFREDVLEKAARLLGLLDALKSHPFLRGKLALKGGTALNLFIFDAPRLSVDIDLNFIGPQDREGMLAVRPKIEQAVQAVFAREGFSIRRIPEKHAGGKWLLRYQNVHGRSGNLEADINFMFRVPLWPVANIRSHAVGSWQATGIPVLDVHELAAGKLAALLARRQSRDLFDSYRIFRLNNLDPQSLRIGFVVYGAMNRKDWRTISIDEIAFDSTELATQLIPTLRVNNVDVQKEPAEYGKLLVEECRKGFSTVFPLTDSELAFLNLLLDKGKIDPTILTTDPSLQQRIKSQPLLQWKALNVRHHKGLSRRDPHASSPRNPFR